MNHIGDIQPNETISLVLVTKNIDDDPIAVDFAPTASIRRSDAHGLVELENVTLDTIETGLKYEIAFTIPDNWEPGEYSILYTVHSEGMAFTVEETFTLLAKVDLDEEEEKDLLPSAGEFMLSSDFQIPATIEINNQTITIELTDPPQFNQTYTVILQPGIASVNGSTLQETKALTFSSEYKPLLSSPKEVQSLLGGLYSYFSIHEVYVTIRDASQKAMQLLGQNPDARNSRYRDIRDNDPLLFPAQKFVAYEAARNLLSKLIIYLINGTEEQKEGLGQTITSGGTFQLGDFMVQDKSGSSSDSGSKEESPMEKIALLQGEIDRELKFWRDAMMGRNRRGYARPVSGSFRSDAGSPEGRDF